MHTSPAGLVPGAIDRLRSVLQGRLVLPGDEDYDQLRMVFPGNVDRRPGAIARVAGTADVARVVTFAAETGTELAVRSGGHSGAGHGVTEGGLVLDLRDMTGLDIHVDGRTAWAETGLTTGAYTAAAGEHGLATGFGDTGSVGLGGITLAGGIGYLVRKHGLTVDNLLAAEVVTADGRVLEVDAESHPDLFWAIRGGGGNFGVVTRLRLRLHRVDEVVGGMLILPASVEVVAGAVAAFQQAGDDLSGIVMVAKAPPMPFLPPEVHGRTIVMVSLVHAGRPDEAEREVAPLRALATPLVDQVGAMRYSDMFPDQEEFRPTAAGVTTFIDDFQHRQAGEILSRIEASTGPMAGVQLRVLGGEMARVPADTAAFAHRDRGLMVNVVAMYQDPAGAASQQAWVEEVAAVLAGPEPHGGYVGFMADEPTEKVRLSYPGAAWDRLRDVKRRYDPANLFRLNHNIPPAD